MVAVGDRVSPRLSRPPAPPGIECALAQQKFENFVLQTNHAPTYVQDEPTAGDKDMQRGEHSRAWGMVAGLAHMGTPPPSHLWCCPGRMWTPCQWAPLPCRPSSPRPRTRPRTPCTCTQPIHRNMFTVNMHVSLPMIVEFPTAPSKQQRATEHIRKTPSHRCRRVCTRCPHWGRKNMSSVHAGVRRPAHCTHRSKSMAVTRRLSRGAAGFTGPPMWPKVAPLAPGSSSPPSPSPPPLAARSSLRRACASLSMGNTWKQAQRPCTAYTGSHTYDSATQTRGLTQHALVWGEQWPPGYVHRQCRPLHRPPRRPSHHGPGWPVEPGLSQTLVPP